MSVKQIHAIIKPVTLVAANEAMQEVGLEGMAEGSHLHSRRGSAND